MYHTVLYISQWNMAKPYSYHTKNKLKYLMTRIEDRFEVLIKHGDRM